MAPKERTPLVDPLILEAALPPEFASNVGLVRFSHNPDLLLKPTPTSERSQRTAARQRYKAPSFTIIGGMRAIFVAELRSATVYPSLARRAS
jgi:hypothetical protein